MLGAVYYGGFGLTNLVNGELFFGPSGFLPYFNTESGAVGDFYARGFGAFLLALASGHFLSGASVALCKQFTVGAILIMVPFIFALRDPDNFKALMFKGQVAMHLV